MLRRFVAEAASGDCGPSSATSEKAAVAELVSPMKAAASPA